MDNFIRSYVKKNASDGADFFFIQVGSNDGQSGDPIHGYIKEYGWKGVLIEPVPFLFEKLKKTYQGFDGLHFENVAIGKEDGTMPFYRIARKTEPDMAYWYDQLGSFKKDVVMSHWERIPNEDKHFVTEEVRVMSLNSLLKKYHPAKIDLLHIDAEGYDYEIIKLVPFSTLSPAMILYEHQHLSPADRLACAELLENQGYTLLEMEEGDTFAFK